MTQGQPLGEGQSEAFVQAHYRGVYRFLFWLCHDTEAAADLTQETFAAFWTSHRDEGDPKSWLYGIARNRWRKRCRDAHPERWLALEEATLLSAAGPETALLHRLDAERVTAALGELSPELRECLVLGVWEELRYAEIAAVVGISEGLARWRVYRARQRLAAILAVSEEAAGAA